MKRLNLLEKKFNSWTVLEEDIKISNKASRWICKCVCGKIKSVLGTNLINNLSKCCGCIGRKNLSLRLKGISPGWTKAKGESSFNIVFSDYKLHAKKLNLEFSILKEEFKNLTQQNCNYCGSIPNQKVNRKDMNGDFIYNGIDRIDSSIGYTIENCVPSCGFCNRAKHNKDILEFEKWLEKLYFFRKNKYET